MKNVYFTAFPGKYFTGDGARKDEDGYYWLLGRVDDVINVSGHRMGTAEIESALVSHAAGGRGRRRRLPARHQGRGHLRLRHPQDRRGRPGRHREDPRGHVREEIGPIASPDFIHFVPELPKTRSGKIMRRILRKIAAGERDMEAFGDISTLADPSIVQTILDTAPQVGLDAALRTTNGPRTRVRGPFAFGEW